VQPKEAYFVECGINDEFTAISKFLTSAALVGGTACGWLHTHSMQNFLTRYQLRKIYGMMMMMKLPILSSAEKLES